MPTIKSFIVRRPQIKRLDLRLYIEQLTVVIRVGLGGHT